MNQITAYAKNIRISGQKIFLVVNQIKKMKPTDAVKILDFVPNKSSKIIKKVLLSAMANARNNFGHKDESLLIKEIIISKGPVFKRSRAVARGRVHPILKRTTHIKVILEAEETKEVPKAPEVSKGEDPKSNIKNQKSK
ncbi:50S ribosomal protein L22 [Candidatus Curtissbacteria bacterium RIFCSPHIGHO2_02_FULL_40_17]|uniref:Large ribosomal subunit protein uL22 n=4 Tax=Candidatus Curtissiibacteriota TaxID=1752717 RepID=A0A1F5GJ91_9BACT|nr:MAG: 50S ribosomal protein L22 [Candidatus Curtissbacteria bacterium RIFCSPHIGHO2_01_FULL_40_12]OGD91951.1 MAG: 50S ribosomal protein L22 [Candidatus Curtissbacteria bacterium RIFCSPHIGHO2_02_FULL_40_17]OGE05202.1 MAG: 50S ribosomal protein L22 [Candidatus Curtissbacteria bacterium RIFCSPHIGHO2_12_FULL_41_17]OGE08140.1 MAG: 50S ribosomal protein L22 [Candidatus Curtissbacteria bacterium RIFCSPLOWO2_02_FULL_40_13b]